MGRRRQPAGATVFFGGLPPQATQFRVLELSRRLVVQVGFEGLFPDALFRRLVDGFVAAQRRHRR